MWQKISERVYKPRKITLWTAICYGLTDFSGGGVGCVISAWMLFFFTTYCNLSATQGASIIAIGNGLTAIFNLLAGGITDNFHRNKAGRFFGRRHFFLIFGAPLMLSFGALWISGLSYWYYLFVYIAFYFIQQMMMVPYETLPNEMTTDFAKRTFLSTTRMVFSALSNFFAAWIPAQLFNVFGQKSAMSLTLNGLFFAVLFMIGIWLTAFNTWELPLKKLDNNESKKNYQDSSNSEKTEGSFLKIVGHQIVGYFTTLRIKTFDQHLLIYITSFTGFDVCNIVFTYYIIYNIHKNATLAGNLLSLSGLGVFATMLAGFLIVKIGPRKLYTLAYSLILVCYIVFYTVGHKTPNNVTIILYCVMLVYVLARAVGYFMPWNLFPFIPDLDELVTGTNRAGTFASVMSFLRSMTSSLGNLFVGIYLDHVGFVKGALHQNISVQNGITNVILFGSGILVLIALICALTFRLDKNTHMVIVDEINRLRNGGSKKDATEETKKITKQLTGVDYSNVWPEKH